VDGVADPVLVACSHGTRSAAGRATVEALRASIRAARPGLEVVPAHVDVHGPFLPDVTADLARRGRAFVVVPLLLSTGYHVRVDIAGAVAAAGGLGRAAGALGPDPLLVDVLLQRLAEAGVPGTDAVVLAAAGSSDPDAVKAVRATAQELGLRRDAPVGVGFASAARPTVAEAVAGLRPGPVAIATYLLAPGVFQAGLAQAGADRVAGPIGTHPLIARLALQRFDAA
jgi:sirohydrochlorin ferrochelatase